MPIELAIERNCTWIYWLGGTTAFALLIVVVVLLVVVETLRVVLHHQRQGAESSRHENLFSTGGRSRATPRALRYGTIINNTRKAIGSAVPGNL